MENILWDFDGVIIDSMHIRDNGFKEIFKGFPAEKVGELIKYHRANGGLSRYVKIRYFFESILELNISQDEIMSYAQRFSDIMKLALINPNNLIANSYGFIKKNHLEFNFHIVSGSDQDELRFLCKKLDLERYFVSIHGSPLPKDELIRNVLTNYNYDSTKTCLIGDSLNDYEAAQNNLIQFYGFNNEGLKSLKLNYIEDFLTVDMNQL